MYKDPEKQKEAVRIAVAKTRKGITSEGITLKGITDEQSIPYKVLSDGQRWYPGRAGYHPDNCTCSIEHKHPTIN